MAYFLRKTNRKRGLYFQICRSYRDPDFKTPRQESYKTYGYAEDMIASGLADPAAYLQNIVQQLNVDLKLERERKKSKQISDSSPLRELGYFPAASILATLMSGKISI